MPRRNLALDRAHTRSYELHPDSLSGGEMERMASILAEARVTFPVPPTKHTVAKQQTEWSAGAATVHLIEHLNETGGFTASARAPIPENLGHWAISVVRVGPSDV